MGNFKMFALDLAFLLSFILGVESTVEKLKCYQCEVREAALCTDEYLLPCPDNQAYDNCLTKIYKRKDDEVWIHKSCALGPCTFRDELQSYGLGLDNCDRSQDEFDCISCCKQNGCNTGKGFSCHPNVALIIILGLCVKVFGLHLFKK